MIDDAIKTCPKCGGELTTGPAPPPAYGEILCSVCGDHFKWEPKPDSKRVKRPAAHQGLVRKLGAEKCDICLRKREDLPHPEILEAHHIERFSDGGAADEKNILIVCSFCHRIIENQRTFLGHYQRRGGEGV